jgi:hypothetical protein
MLESYRESLAALGGVSWSSYQEAAVALTLLVDALYYTAGLYTDIIGNIKKSIILTGLSPQEVDFYVRFFRDAQFGFWLLHYIEITSHLRSGSD